jgi:transcription antitermination factor NusA-like protein
MFKRTSKHAYEMLVPTIKKNLTRRRKEFDATVKGVDEALKPLTPEQKVTVRNKGTMKETVKEISKIIDEGEKKGLDMSVKKAKGGRVGLKLGSRKSNVQKIQETFGPKKKVPNKFKGFSKLPEKVQQKIDAKLAKKV